MHFFVSTSWTPPSQKMKCPRKGVNSKRQEIERRGRAFQVALRQVEIAHRGGDVSMPQETLDAVEIDPGLQEMCGEGVPKSMDPALLPDPRLFFGVVIDLLSRAWIDGTPPIA
jgi:hypothetical protein